MELGVRHFQTNPYLWVIQWLLTTSDAWSRIPKQLFAIPIPHKRCEITSRTNSIYSTSIYLFRNGIWDNLWNQQRNIYQYDWLRSLFRYCIIYIYVHRDDYILCIYHWYTDCFPKPDTYIYICNMYIYISIVSIKPAWFPQQFITIGAWIISGHHATSNQILVKSSCLHSQSWIPCKKKAG